MPSIELLNPKQHARAEFACGEPSLDQYICQQAAQHHRQGIATTHVLVDNPGATRILGYYTLSAAQMLLADLREEDRRHLPRYPVPAVRMGRLAVTAEEQGNGYGAHLLAHAVARCLGLREQLGVRVLVVDALHDQAASFYLGFGFRQTSEQSRTLYLRLG